MSHIHVKVNYGGRITQERRILPGVYVLDDPRLFGVGQYLLDNGHAVAVVDPQAIVIPTPPPMVEDNIGFAVVEPEVTGTGVMAHNGELINRPLGASAFEAPEEVTEDEPQTPKGKRK